MALRANMFDTAAARSRQRTGKGKKAGPDIVSAVTYGKASKAVELACSRGHRPRVKPRDLYAQANDGAADIYV